MFALRQVCVLTYINSFREEKYNANILILPTLGCVFAWLMASRPVVARKLTVCVKSLKLQREVIAGV